MGRLIDMVSCCRVIHRIEMDPLLHHGSPSRQFDPPHRLNQLSAGTSGIMFILIQNGLEFARKMNILTRFQKAKRLVSVKNRHDPCMNRNINPSQGTLILEIIETFIVKEELSDRLEQPASTFFFRF